MTIHPTLRDMQILVAEDDFFLADELCRALAGAGAVLLGPVPSVARALALVAAAPRIDAAVLDANLIGERAYPIADVLAARRVPFVFTSGYDEATLRQRYPGAPHFQKPADVHAVSRALMAVLAP